jgi:hypothetical protein
MGHPPMSVKLEKNELLPESYIFRCRESLGAALYASHRWYDRWCAHSRRWTWSRASRTADCTAHVLARDTPALALPAKAPVDSIAAARPPATIKTARPTLGLEAIDVRAMVISLSFTSALELRVGQLLVTKPYP